VDRAEPQQLPPQVFIASSEEGLAIAQRISKTVDAAGARPMVWWDHDVFRPGDPTLTRLIDLTKRVAFAIVVLTPDDLVTRRGTRKHAPRDNTIFEAGLFVASLGPEKTFIVHPETLAEALPTDLRGVTTIRYRIGARGQVIVKPAADKISEAIDRLHRGNPVSMTFLVEVPSAGEADAFRVGIAGTFDELDRSQPHWQAIEMQPGEDALWTFGVSGREWQEIEYKYMLGPPWDWSRVETWADGNYRENRAAALRSDQAVRHDRVEAWSRI
jgi:CAP12/Pycsar effector protein, TIR domain